MQPLGRADPGNAILPNAIDVYGCIPSPDYLVDYTISKRNSSVPQLLVKNCPVIDEVKFRGEFWFSIAGEIPNEMLSESFHRGIAQ